MIKIKHNKTNEELTFSDDWEVVGKMKIQGDAFVKLFKHWVEANQSAFMPSRLKPVYRYDKDKDMLFYTEADPEYGIGFFRKSALEGLEDGKLYSYNDLVGEE